MAILNSEIFVQKPFVKTLTQSRKLGNEVENLEKHILTLIEQEENKLCKTNDIKIQRCTDNKEFKEKGICVFCETENSCSVKFSNGLEKSHITLANIKIEEGGKLSDLDFKIDRYVAEFCKSITKELNFSSLVSIIKEVVKSQKFTPKLKVSNVTETEIQVTYEEKSITAIGLAFDNSAIKGFIFSTPYGTNSVEFTQTDDPFVKSELTRALKETLINYENLYCFSVTQHSNEDNQTFTEFTCPKVLYDGQKVLDNMKSLNKDGEGFKSIKYINQVPFKLSIDCQNSLISFTVECTESGSDHAVKFSLEVKKDDETMQEFPKQYFMKKSFYNMVGISNAYFNYFGPILAEMC